MNSILELFETCYNHLTTLKGHKKPILRKGVGLQNLQKYKSEHFFPSELENLYLNYDGIIEPVEMEIVTDFYISPNDGYLLPLSECENHINQIIILENMVEQEFGKSLLGDRKNKCFPLLYDGYGGYLLVMDTGEIVNYYGNCTDDFPPIMYENIQSFFETLLHCFEKTIFYIESNETITFERNRLYQEIAKLNPNIELWKTFN